MNYLPGSAHVSINIDLFEELERAEGKDRDYWLFMTAVTILHELVHYGELQNNIKDGSKEGGSDFERKAYGQIINTRTGSNKSVLDNWMKRTGQLPLDYFYINNGSNSNGSNSNGSQKHKQKKKPNADREAAKRSGGAH